MSSAAVSTNLVPPGYSSSTNPPPLPMTTAAGPPARSPSPSPRPLAPALPALAPPPTASTKTEASPASSSASAAAAAAAATTPAAPATTNVGRKAKQVVYLGAARCKRKAADFQWPCKKQKAALAHIIYSVGDHTLPPPPARVAPRPLVVELDATGAATKAAKALKGLDAGEASSSSNSSSGSAKAIHQLTSAAAAAAASASAAGLSSLGATASSSSSSFSSSSLPGPPTGAGSVGGAAHHSSSSSGSGGNGASSPAPPLLGPTRKSTSAAAAAVAAEQSRREEEAARAASVVTPAMEAALGRAEAALEPGMAELLGFLLHAKVRLLDHAGLLAAVEGALARQVALRKAYCDFEAVWACGDGAQVSYGKRPAAVFAELLGKEGPGPVETYDERVFLRLFVVFVATRLQLARQMVAGDEGAVALVDGLLKPWVARAYDYI